MLTTIDASNGTEDAQFSGFTRLARKIREVRPEPVSISLEHATVEPIGTKVKEILGRTFTGRYQIRNQQQPTGGVMRTGTDQCDSNGSMVDPLWHTHSWKSIRNRSPFKRYLRTAA